MYPEPRRRGADGDAGRDNSDEFDGAEDFELDPDASDDQDDENPYVNYDDLIELDELGNIEEEIAALLAQPPARHATGSLAGIGNGPATDEQLMAFSDLSLDALREFATGWMGLAADTRRALVEAMDGLAEHRLDADFRRVFRVALLDEDAGVRQLALSALTGDDSPGIVRPLLALLADDPSVDVRAEAARALGPVAFGAETGEYDDHLADAVREGLMEAARDGDPLVRRIALESAAVFGGEEIADLIREAYDSGEHDMIASALYAMGRTFDRQWLPTLLEELGSDDAQLRFEAARAIGAVGQREAVADLLAAMNGEDDVEVRHAIIAALGEIGGKAAQRALTTLQSHAEPADEEALEEALDEVTFGLEETGR